MGATHIKSKTVCFPYYLQDATGNEFALEVTATVEETPADENGGTYPPTVNFDSAGWTDRTGAFERVADINTLPIDMKLCIWAKAVQLANMP